MLLELKLTKMIEMEGYRTQNTIIKAVFLTIMYIFVNNHCKNL